MVEFSLDVKSAIADFEKYDAKTQKRFKHTMMEYAGELADKQRAYLLSKAKTWNNNIGSTFSAGKWKRDHVEVGPGDRVAYAWFLEEGASRNQQARGNTFAGYHYVKTTLRLIKNAVTRALKKDIERS